MARAWLNDVIAPWRSPSRAFLLADRQVAIGQAALKLMILRVGRGERFPDGLRRVERLDRLDTRVDLLGDLPHAEIGVCQLLAEVGIVVALIDETLVILERRIEQFPAQAANVDGVLLLEERVLADAGQVVFHGLLGHVEVGLGLLADLGLPAAGRRAR